MQLIRTFWHVLLRLRIPPVLVPGSLALALALATAALGLTTSQGRSGRTLLGQGLWEDLRGKVKHFTEVFDALVGQGVVVPTPAVDFLQVVAGSKGPQDHHHVQVWDVLQLIVLAGLLLGQHLESFKPLRFPLHASLNDMIIMIYSTGGQRWNMMKSWWNRDGTLPGSPSSPPWHLPWRDAPRFDGGSLHDKNQRIDSQPAVQICPG